MKTEKEQIEEMAHIMCEYYNSGFCANSDMTEICEDMPDCCYKNEAEALYNAGYGDVSEYKAEIERLKAEYEELQTNAEILASGVRDLNHENYELTQKLAKQTRIARDANAKFTGVEHYLKPFQYKADRLKTKCDDLKKLSDWQREEIKRLKAEVNKGCDNCETVKQAQIDVLKKIKNCREATDSDCYPYLERIVNNLIEEVQNAEDKG